MTIPGSRVTVEGHAIVSSDGMISDAKGEMPSGLRNDADWRLFQDALDRAALVVIGRLGHERHPNPGRRRLVMTQQVAGLLADRSDPMATFWNPAGVSIGSVLRQLGVVDGALAVTGGTAAFDMFLPWFDRFLLSEVPGLAIPGGRPCFSGGAPGVVLNRAGMNVASKTVIDNAAGVTFALWTRRA
jgi:hypothetical protein